MVDTAGKDFAREIIDAIHLLGEGCKLLGELPRVFKESISLSW
jgi:hypothetical protein